MSIAEIKAQLSILEVLNHYGLKPDKNKRICCPFHEDKTPSMQVYPETNMVFCFSSNCKLHGKAIDQIDFILHKETSTGSAFTKHEAILKAGTLAGITSINSSAMNNHHENNLPNGQASLAEIFKKLQSTLHQSKKGKEYLESRNLYDVKIEAGYNPAWGTENGSEKYKALKNCIVFPLKDSSGNIVSFYGRSISNNGEAKHYYSKDRKGLYPGYPSEEITTVILTESVIDSLTINHYTNFYSLALYGTNGFTTEHEQVIRELTNLQEVILFFDGDEAGRKAVEKYSEQLKALRPDVKISSVTTPEGEDPNSLVQSHAPEILTHLIDQRETLYQTFFSSNGKLPEETAAPIIESSNYPIIKLNTNNPDYITYTYENLTLHIIGGIALYPIDKLKITLKIEIKDSNNPLHSIRQSNLDLYSDEQLQRFIRSASERLDVGSKDMHLAIASLIQELEQYRHVRIEEQKPKIEKQKVLSESRKQELLKLLQSKNLFAKLNELIGFTGVVGEENNRLIMWTVFTSRLMHTPLHIICLGASGTGKTYLQEKISELIPKQHKVTITASTENALYYVGKTEYKHKLLLIEDLDGVSSNLLTLRELQSKAFVSKLVPVKDSKGNMKTIRLEVEGPICLSGTTTKEKLYEDNANRCLLIYLDNSEEQQKNIMQYQRKLHAGTINKAKEEATKELLQDMQLMFKNITVVNPYAEKLTIPETVFKPLRTNAHYLQFIEAITFVHQFQRQIKKNQEGKAYIETTLEDIELANALLKDVLLAKSDELTNACRNFLENLKSVLQEEKKQSFYRSEVREKLKINPHNLNHYLKTLHFYGYVKSIGGNKYKGGYEYEITRKDEYTQLQNAVTTALDKALQNIRKQ